MGFGAVSNTTVLGQPLAFTVPLRMDADEFVSVECVFAEVHAGDARVPPAQVRVSLDASREGGERLLRITTSAMIDEPVVSIEVGLGCPVRLSRKFVAFVDPPVITLAQAPPPEAAQPPAASSEPSAAQPPSPAIVAPPPAPRTTRPQAAAAPKVAQRKAARPVARPTVIAAPTVAPTPRARSEEPRAKVAPAAPATAGGARLKLETAEAPARTAAAAAQAASKPETSASPATIGATESSVAIAAAAAASAADAQQSQESERLRLLEESVARVRSDTEETRSSITTLQARLREAEASRYANPLVYALVALVALLLFAMAMMWVWVRARDKQRADWWAATAEEAAQQRQRPAAPPPVERPPARPPPPDSVISAAVVDSMPAPAGPATWKPTLAIPELDKNEVPKRAVTAEELIDLEQQAEFFITLGQDDSAIDLLVGHLNSSGGISPLPYLKLMEIHRRRGDLAAYERIREHFNQRFNAYAPAGNANATPVRSLDEYPDVMAQLQEAWPAPARAMGLLESLLFKSGGRDAAFDLAAYREVLFLHEVARDLYEHDSSPTTVDVLLPLDSGSGALSSHPLMTTMSSSHAGIGPRAEVDLDLGRPRDEEAEAAAARAERRKEHYGDDDFLFGSHTGGDWDTSGNGGKGGTRGRKGSK